MAKRFSAEERKKIIEQYENDGSEPEGFYIIKNKKGIYNIRKKKDKNNKEEASSENSSESTNEEPKKKEPKPQTL